ncbi:MAG: hypothetical protein CFH34_00914 [Alphaproteobacteria bacterium MarineAlpha9_Bin4]|nr:hypothetical protein [Pelagibacterales bacterium]PPR26524.1 MAG: hypothetical protein CFH34_00914 [Alphaproteobacteria bacterium MarineAlpha9_Bin4]
MKYILIINLALLYVTLSKAEKYINESSSSVKSDHINITKDLKSTTVVIENRWTDSFGEYGTGKCNGHILTENKAISLIIYCEQLASNGDKFWTQLIRDKNMEAGIGKIRFLNGTGKYKKFIGIECPYAVNYMNEKINFFKQICELP